MWFPQAQQFDMKELEREVENWNLKFRVVSGDTGGKLCAEGGNI